MTGKYLMAALLLVLTIPAYAQTKEVVGIVTSTENRDLLSGIVVWVKGTNHGVVTGSDGFFDLTVTEGDTIEASSQFFQTAEIIVGSGRSYELRLETKSRSRGRTGQMGTDRSQTDASLYSSNSISRYGLRKEDSISERKKFR